MMHGRLKARNREFKRGEIVNLRGCIALHHTFRGALSESYINAHDVHLSAQNRKHIPCSTGGFWLACCECKFSYGNRNCISFRNGKRKYTLGSFSTIEKRKIMYRLIHIESGVKNGSVNGLYVEYYDASGVWEEGYR